MGKPMIMTICQYPFKCRTFRELEDRPGAFAVMSEFYSKYYLLDVDCSDDVKKAVEEHERRKCWEKHRKGTIEYAVLYESDFPSKTKEEIMNEVRRKYSTIPCGGSPL